MSIPLKRTKLMRGTMLLLVFVLAAINLLAPRPIRASGSGTVWASGKNGNGELGNGTIIASSVPVQASGLTGVVSVAANGYHNLALKSDGSLWTWGYNAYGQLGIGTTTDRNVPTQVSSLTGVVAIGAGGYHSLSVKSDGSLWSWGFNAKGQLGTGTITNSSVPVQVSGLTEVVAAAGGDSHSLALKSDGTVWAWGRNTFGALGNGTTLSSFVPVQVSGLTGVGAIAVGNAHNLALKSDGTVWAWGLNDSGQLGIGTTSNSLVPVKVNSLAGVVAVAAGRYYSLALKSDGTVWAWGLNNYAMLGNGTTTNSSVPVQVSGLTSVAAIAGGGWGGLALKSDSTVWVWGRNDYGELGIGAVTPYSSIPVQVTALNGSTAITGGWGHNVALKSNVHTLTATASAGGSIAPSGAVTVEHGASQTFIITPDTGYSIANVLVDGASVGTVESYAFNNVSANHTVVATFANLAATYTITATAGNGGTITPSGTVTVGYNASQTFSITPNAGNEIADVVVDGASVGPVASYTFNNVSADHTIAATFSNPNNTAIDLQVAAGADDATETAREYLVANDDLIVHSYPGATPYQRVSTGLRFQNVAIPQGATIVSSYVSVYATTTAANDANMKLYLENSGDAADFVANPHIINTTFRPRTAAYASWVQDDVAVNTYVASPSLNSPLQELVNRQDWAAGNDVMVLMMANEDVEKSIRFWHQEKYLHLPARLHVEYSNIPVPDVTAPLRSNGQPVGPLPSGTTQATISLTTNEPATAKYSTVPGPSYESMADTFSTTGGTAHSTLVTGLTDGNTYTYYVRTMDASGNQNSDDFAISFSVALPDTTPPEITGVQATGIQASAVSVYWSTDDASDSTVSYGITPSLGSTASSSNLVTNHTISLSGLLPRTTYYYQVSSRNSDGYSSTSSTYEFTTLNQSISIDLQIAAGADDATETAREYLVTNDDLIVHSYPGATPYQRVSTGLRFQNVAIPQGATIVSSYISVYATTTTANDANMKLYLENTGDAADFVANPHVISTASRPRTEAYSSWVQDDVAVNTYVASPSLNLPLQELVNRQDWANSNDVVVLMIANEDVEKSIRFWHQEKYLHLPARLHVEYSN